MGLFRVRGPLTGPTGRSEDAELLVDTRATLLAVPLLLAARLEWVMRRSQPVLIAGGRRVAWPVADVSLSLKGPDVTTPCFMAPDGPAILGAVAIESLFLAVDPIAKRLIPIEGFVGDSVERVSVGGEDEIAVQALDARLTRERFGGA